MNINDDDLNEKNTGNESLGGNEIKEEIQSKDMFIGKIKSDKEKIVRFRGKNIKLNELERKIGHRPRLFGIILINLAIIIIILIILLLIS
ncbi:MAG: hypothetical protein ACFFAN_10170 [Promethearchaeota archaeon]